MPLEHAPSHLRLAFHDAGTHDARIGRAEAVGQARALQALLRAMRNDEEDVR